jgi:HME family heavy-metal exporter
VATVIVGGLVSSTLLDFFVHPALFWTFGLGSARRVVESEERHIPLVEESDED